MLQMRSVGQLLSPPGGLHRQLQLDCCPSGYEAQGSTEPVLHVFWMVALHDCFRPSLDGLPVGRE